MPLWSYGQILSYCHIDHIVLFHKIYGDQTWHNGDFGWGVPTDQVTSHLSCGHLTSRNKQKMFYLYFHHTYKHQTWNSVGLVWGFPTDQAQFHMIYSIKLGTVVTRVKEPSLSKSYVSLIMWLRMSFGRIKTLYLCFNNTYVHVVTLAEGLPLSKPRILFIIWSRDAMWQNKNILLPQDL